MDITKLKQKFPLIVNAFMDQENHSIFLRIEVNLQELSQVTDFSREVLEWLDTQKFKLEYDYLDIFSSRTEIIITFEKLDEYLGKSIKLILNKPFKDKRELTGTLLYSKPLKLRWNKKGQIRTDELPLNIISKITLIQKKGNHE